MIDFHSPEFWLAVSFCTVVAVVAYPVYKKLGEFGKNQALKITNEIETAANLRKEAESLYKEYEEKTKNAEKEKMDMITLAEKEAFLLQQKSDKELSKKLALKKEKIKEKVELVELHAQKEMMNRSLKKVIHKTNVLLKQTSIRQDEQSMDNAIDKAFTQLKNNDVF